MLDPKIFCNIPWFEVHINADGTYHTCGAQRNSISNGTLAEKYNVHNMPISEWVNSEYQRRSRLEKLNGIAEPLCGMCYQEDQVGSSSKRVKENHKSQIFDSNFEESYNSSPDLQTFEYSNANQGLTDIVYPNSYHISLGNECNLACKMCSPTASSRRAVELRKANLYFGPAKMNWTTNDQTWDQVTRYVCETPNLKFVHLLGGEPLLNPKFENLIDRLIAAKQTDIYLGFTTNGTVFSPEIMDKLDQFRHVDVGISIECAGLLNDYIRKGSNTQEILDNIDQYLPYRKESHVYVTIRTVPSAISVHTLDDLYRWCISRKVDVMSNVLLHPAYLQIRNLPLNIKQRLLEQYNRWEFAEPFKGLSNPRDPNRFRDHIDSEIRAVIKLLGWTNDARQTEILYKELERWAWFDNPHIRKYFFID